MLQKTFRPMPKDQQVAGRDIHQPVTREWRDGRCHGPGPPKAPKVGDGIRSKSQDVLAYIGHSRQLFVELSLQTTFWSL